MPKRLEDQSLTFDFSREEFDNMSQFLSPTSINEPNSLTGTFMFPVDKENKAKISNLSSIEAGENLSKLEESSLFIQDSAK